MGEGSDGKRAFSFISPHLGLHHTQITGILESKGVSMGEGSDGKRAFSFNFPSSGLASHTDHWDFKIQRCEHGGRL
jgi:hypothetical protein